MAPWAVAVAALVAANPPLDEARGLVRGLRYEQALEPLRRATQVPTSTVAERRESYELLVRTLAALGRLDDAEVAYEELLAADPGAPGPVGAAPRITAAFERAKQKVYPGDWVRLAQLASPPGELRLSVTDPWSKVTRVVLDEEVRGELTLALVDGEGRAQLSSPTARWTARAEGADGHALAQLAAAAERLLPPPRASPEPAVAGALTAGAELSTPAPRPRWPFLVLAAVGVAAGAAAAGLAVSASSDSRSAPQQTYAAQVRALDTSARTKAVGAYLAGGGSAAALTGAAFGLWWSAP